MVKLPFGHVIKRDLARTLQLFADKAHRQRCIAELAVDDSPKLNRVLNRLGELTS